MTRSLIALSVSVALFGLALAELNAQAEPLDVHRGYGWPLREPPVVQTWSNTLFSTSPKAVSGMPTEFVRPNSALPSAANRGAAQRRLPGFGPIVGLVKPRVQPATDTARPEIFNYKYGYINPYYPFPADTVQIRPGANDFHEGWVSKYLYTLPTVSPYMGLLRHDFTPYGSTKYDAFVKPRIDSFYHVSKPPAYVAAVPPLRK